MRPAVHAPASRHDASLFTGAVRAFRERHVMLPLLALAYLATARAGLALAPLEAGRVAAVWAPTGIAVAGVLLAGPLMIPLVLLADLVAALQVGVPLPAAACLAAGNALVPALSFLFLKRKGLFHVGLTHVRDVLALVGYAATFSTLASATVGVWTLNAFSLIDRADRAGVWRVWWLSDGASVLILAPLLMVWLAPRERVAPRPRVVELLVLPLMALVVLTLAFSFPFRFTAFPFGGAYFLFPIILWAAARTGHRGSTLVTMTVAAFATANTVTGTGPFVRPDLAESVVALQLFVGIMSITGLVVAAAVLEREGAVAEREVAYREIAAHRDELEVRVIERTRELARANEELEAFTARVTHDLRAPIRRIQWLLDVTEEDHGPHLPNGAGEYLARAHAEADRASDLVDDLLELARVSRKPVHRERVDVTALAWTSVDALRENEPTREAHVHVDEGMIAHADPALLRIALDNLIGNAWKYTRREPVAEIRVTGSVHDGETVIEVQDNGVGFDPDAARKLFRPFERLHSPQEFEGTGVGLTTVKRVVERHKGTITATGVPGEGATFRFTLGPASSADAGPPPE